MKCNYCEEQLERIIINHGTTRFAVSEITLEPSKERANLYVCTSRDCKNCGVVLAIPCEAKD